VLSKNSSELKEKKKEKDAGHDESCPYGKCIDIAWMIE
jgi:hypothetical protein